MRHKPIDIPRQQANVSCCNCAKVGAWRNVMLLPFQAPDGFKGWGCTVCQLPARGAMAIICDGCKADGATADTLQSMCSGVYALSGERTLLKDFDRIPFGHRIELHPELERK